MSDDLRRLAEQADTGTRWDVDWNSPNLILEMGGSSRILAKAFVPGVSDWIAAANPQAILALLDERDAANASVNDAWDGIREVGRRVAALKDTGKALLAVVDSVNSCHGCLDNGDGRDRDTVDKARALLAAAPSERCDRIVNNGMGEPTECGRTLPCEYHDPAALPAEAGEDIWQATGRALREASDHAALVASGLHECASDCQTAEEISHDS